MQNESHGLRPFYPFGMWLLFVWKTENCIVGEGKKTADCRVQSADLRSVFE